MIRKKEQTFNDGALTVYSIKNEAADGCMPIERLVKKAGPLRYHERTVGVTRFYTARQNRERIDRVLRVPRQSGISPLDVCIPADGQQYRIKQVQHPEDVYPSVYDLALERVGVDYEFDKTS